MNAPKKRDHRLAGKTMTGADMIVQVLADEGVNVIFGYSGGAILPTYDAVFRYNENPDREHDMPMIVPANEQGATFMAAGLARATGKVGVAMVTSGPGATNCVTSVRDCMADSVPIVLICGQVPRAAVGTDAFQEAPVFNIMSACSKHVFLVKDETELEATVRTAFHIARTGRPGPVVIDVPKDVQNWEGAFQGSGLLNFRGYQDRLDALDSSHVTQEEAKDFFDLLSQSNRPLVYAGGGVISSNAAHKLREFMEHFQIPGVTTLMGIGAIDTTSDLSLKMLGMHGMAYANYAVEDCDLLIAIGSRFDDRVAGKVQEFAPNARIAHIDIDAAEIGKVKLADWACAGDAQKVLDDLMELGKDFKKDFGPWVEHVKKLKEDYRLNYERDCDAIQPQEVIEVLNEITKGDAIVATGVGQHQMWAAQYFDFHQPRSFLTSGSMGTMGFGLPAAIGAKFGCPDKVVIDVDGDGSLRMNLGEMETCTTYDVGVKILLLNNLGDGMVRQWQQLYFQGRLSGSDKQLHKKDFVKSAEADGFGFARRLVDRTDLRGTLEDFVAHDGPAFLEVMIDLNAMVYPMVGPGMGYKEMVTGPYIPSREAPPDLRDFETADLF